MLDLANIDELKSQYTDIQQRIEVLGEEAVDPTCLLSFDYEYPDQESEIVIDTDEFTAVCPWTGLPDQGTLVIKYVPFKKLMELKSVKYYLFSYRQVGIVQEHAANRILQDLINLCEPRRLTLTLDYNVRGGLHTTVKVEYTAQ
jgi:7-cyano-7-deazaguanine reductase